MSDLAARLKSVGEERCRAEPITDRGDYMHVYAKISRADGALLIEAATALSSQEAEIERLKAALEPFSDMAGEMFARGWDASNVAIALDNPGDPHRVTAGDFFAARRLLKVEG